jgi:hypothetical protein
LTDDELLDWSESIAKQMRAMARHISQAKMKNPHTGWLLALWQEDSKKQARPSKKDAAASVVEAAENEEGADPAEDEEGEEEENEKDAEPDDDAEEPPEKIDDDDAEEPEEAEHVEQEKPLVKKRPSSADDEPWMYGYDTQSKQAYRAKARTPAAKQFMEHWDPTSYHDEYDDLPRAICASGCPITIKQLTCWDIAQHKAPARVPGNLWESEKDGTKYYIVRRKDRSPILILFEKMEMSLRRSASWRRDTGATRRTRMTHSHLCACVFVCLCVCVCLCVSV